MKKLILIISILLICQALNASECYHYHTSTKMEIIKINGGLFFQFTEKDPNGFSFVRQYKRPLKGIDISTYKLIDDNIDRFIFEDKNGFYNLQKRDQYNEGDAKFFKILKPNEATKNINGQLFLINNKWTYILGWYDKIEKIVIKELPVNIIGIKAYSNAIIIKDEQKVYSISFDFQEKTKYTITQISNLNPKETVLYVLNSGLNSDYMADSNHFFSLRNDGTFEDLTPQLLTNGLGSGMNGMKLLNQKVPIWQVGKLILKKKDGASSTLRNPITGEEIDIYYAYSSAKLLTDQNGNSTYTLFHNKIYFIWDDVFSEPLRVDANANDLILVSSTLFKDDHFYYMQGDAFNILNTKITASAHFFEGAFSYGKYLPKALVDDEYIHFIGDRFDSKTDVKTRVKAKDVKQLGMFYLFNHSLFDGQKSYPIKADEETLEYLGSFVEVINGCSGSNPGSPSVEVKYHNFLKDKDNVYYLDEALKQLVLIQTADVAESKTNDYDYMQSLYKIKDVKGTVIKRKTKLTEKSPYLIWGIVGVVFIGGLVFVLRKKIKQT